MTTLCIRSYCGHGDERHYSGWCNSLVGVLHEDRSGEFVTCRCEGMLRDNANARKAQSGTKE